MLSAISVTIQICLILTVATEIFARLLQKPYAAWVRNRARPILLGGFAIGMLVPSIWAMYAFIVAIVPIMARTRSQIAPIYLVTVVAVPPLQSFLVIGSLYLFDVDRYVFAAIGAAVAYFMRGDGEARLPRAGLDLPIVILAVLGAIAVRGTTYTNMLRTDATIAFSLVIPYVILSRTFRKPEDVARLMLALGLCGFALSLVGFYEMKRIFLPYELVQSRMGVLMTVSSYSHQRGGALRATASFVEATAFATFVSLSFIALLSIRGMFRSTRAWQIAMAGLLMGLYAANSRSGLLALIVGVLTYDYYAGRYGKLVKKIAGFAVLGVAAVTLSQFSYKLAARLGLAGDSVGTTDYRKQLLSRGWEEIQKHPLRGMPSSQIYAALADLRQGEGIVDFVNAYIWYGLIAGIGGMIALLLVFLLAPMRALLNRRRLRRLPGGLELAAAIFAAGLMGAVSAGTQGFNTRHALIMLVMFAALARMCGMRPVVERAEPPPGDPSAPAVPPQRVLAPA